LKQAKTYQRYAVEQRSKQRSSIAVGRVTLRQAVPYRDVTDIPELRAATGRIDELWVLDDAIGSGQAEKLRKGLSARYGVPVVVGQPAYNHHHWDTKTCPDWKYERVGLQRPWRPPRYADFIYIAQRKAALNYAFQRRLM